MKKILFSLLACMPYATSMQASRPAHTVQTKQSPITVILNNDLPSKLIFAIKTQTESDPNKYIVRIYQDGRKDKEVFTKALLDPVSSKCGIAIYNTYERVSTPPRDLIKAIHVARRVAAQCGYLKSNKRSIWEFSDDGTDCDIYIPLK